MQNGNSHSPLKDTRVREVIDRVARTLVRPADGGPIVNPAASRDPKDYAEYGLSIDPEQGDLIYLLCRAMGAKRVVDFATSVGMSALYFASAVRDNGGGSVIGAELLPSKIATAKRNLTDAGLVDYVEIREGDARQTLSDLGGPVDFILVDGFPNFEQRSLARDIIEITAPQLRRGGYVLNDNAEADFLDYVRDPANGFISLSLPMKYGTELCVKVA